MQTTSTPDKMNRIDLVKFVLPLLMEPKPKNKRYARSSYGLKHEVEYALRFYITNDEMIEAGKQLGWMHTEGDPNYTFYVKAKFPSYWFQPYSRREHEPLRSQRLTKEWKAYQAACAEIDAWVEEATKADTSEDTRFQKLAKVVGYHS